MSSLVTAVSARALSAGLAQMVRRGLRGIWVRGELPPTATVWAANHHSWWDGFLAGAVLQHEHRAASLMMDPDNLASFGFLRSIGVVSSNRPRQALQTLREGRVLVIFPEGDLRAPGPLHALAPGAAWLARRAAAPLVPVAVRVTNRGHQHAEAFLDIGDSVDEADLAPALSKLVRELDAEIEDADPRLPLPGFDLELAGRSSWDERIARWSSRTRR